MLNIKGKGFFVNRVARNDRIHKRRKGIGGLAFPFAYKKGSPVVESLHRNEEKASERNFHGRSQGETTDTIAIVVFVF